MSEFAPSDRPRSDPPPAAPGGAPAVAAPTVGTGTPRDRVLGLLAESIPAPTGPDCVRVAVDGVDGAGKTVLADELAAVLRARGRDVVRVSADDFHHVRAVRHRRGRDSPEGFWLDTYDYARLRSDVLDPLGPGGDRRYRPAAHDLESDAVLRPPRRLAPAGAVLVLDGLFLHRDGLFLHRDGPFLHREGLAHGWDFSVWLDVPFEITVARMAARDGTHPDPAHPSMRRYVEGQRLYLAACDPASRADLVIDNAVPERPVLRHRR